MRSGAKAACNTRLRTTKLMNETNARPAKPGVWFFVPGPSNEEA
jgi:hypothetical protein